MNNLFAISFTGTSPVKPHYYLTDKTHPLSICCSGSRLSILRGCLSKLISKYYIVRSVVLTGSNFRKVNLFKLTFPVERSGCGTPEKFAVHRFLGPYSSSRMIGSLTISLLMEISNLIAEHPGNSNGGETERQTWKCWPATDST
jgi:hypothetical protein